MIGIIDYGMGNIHSVQKALEVLGAETLVTNKPQEIKQCAKIVLPGVGAFDDAAIELEKRGLSAAIKEAIAAKKIFLGICLGMQLLFDKSEEGKKPGLGIIKGSVKKFKASSSLKVPHMGWNTLKFRQKDCPLFTGLEDGCYVYFCHSYYPAVSETVVTAATANYGLEFSAIVRQDNVYGVQFHPEKSQETGIKILKNFIQI
ncbi:MAG: imidazole glycerol phosphate synthase subunit HisH [Candidatus Omnitrophota bacterium]